jgi:peptide/nickel transport system substrate-binding protein
LDGYLDTLFETTVGTPEYLEILKNITRYEYDNALMLLVPIPNRVLAVNKEVIFYPYQQAVLPLWEISLSRLHSSIRPGAYPESLKKPVEITRYNFD